MRTDPSTPAGILGARMRAQAQRVERAWREQAPAVRWGLAAALLALLSAALYLSVAGSNATALVKGGQAFTPDDLRKIETELVRKHIAYQVDDGRRLVVPADSVSEANDVVQKLGAGARSLEDILDEGEQARLFDDPRKSEQRRLHARGAYLSELIRRLPGTGIIAAHVDILKRSTPYGPRSSGSPTAFVMLETEGNREVRFQVIKTIEEMIVAREPDIKPDAISIFDQGGHHYVEARKPELREQTHTHAREEELSERILDQIDHIKGVQVTVQLVPVAAPEPTPEPEPAPAPEPEPAGEPPRIADLLPPAITVNQPAELVAAPAPKPAPPPRPPVAKAEPPRAPGPLARVWIKVPRSWYLRMHPSRQPTPDELRKAKEENDRQIRTAVEHVIPPSEAKEIAIDTIPDELPARVPATLPVAPEARNRRWVWVLMGMAAGIAVTLIPLGVHFAAWRRPAPRPARPADLGWFHVDEADEAGPGPSERVRELIRLNPEAAASVLHRWTGQGGPVE